VYRRQPTVSWTVAFVTDRIVAKRNTWIVFPRTTQEFDVASQSWQATKRFPYCFGAVDGCLIKVQVPPRQHNPTQYYSGRKKFHCINIQDHGKISLLLKKDTYTRWHLYLTGQNHIYVPFSAPHDSFTKSSNSSILINYTSIPVYYLKFYQL